MHYGAPTPAAKTLQPDPSKGTKFDLTLKIYQTDRLEFIHTAHVSHSTSRAKYGPYFCVPSGLDFSC